MPAIKKHRQISPPPRRRWRVGDICGAICDLSMAKQQASAWIYSEPAATESAAIKKMPVGKICSVRNIQVPAEAEVNNPVVEQAQPQLSQAEAIASHS